MYSPKINEALVPVLYRLAKERSMPMTSLVDGIIRQALSSNSLPRGKLVSCQQAASVPESELRKAVA